MNPRELGKGKNVIKPGPEPVRATRKIWKLVNILFGERQTLRAEGKGLLFKEPTLFDALRKSSREG